MALTSFMPGPTYDAFTPQEFTEQAFAQPFSMAETFGQSAVGGVLSSFGLGTALRAGTTDAGRQFVPLDDQSREPPVDLSQSQIRPETNAEVSARGDTPLDQEQYKSSRYYRQQIPWDQSMTENRARDLAQYADAQSVRDEIARRRPWTAAAGNVTGSALDPINYVPVLGEGATAAASARLGVIGGRALIGGADAAINVGIAGLLTAPTRAQFGDDISWQSQVSQMAMGAALGAGFGALGGIFKVRADARAEGLRSDIEQRLATVRNGQESMATLREAVAGLANDGEVRLGDTSMGRVTQMADQVARESDAVGRAYDEVHAQPTGPVNDPLVRITPEEIDGTIMARGAFKDINSLEFSQRGYGFVKFIWKQGEESVKPPELQISREDLTSFPQIIRDYEPSRVSADGNRREWRVEREGRTVVYADKVMNGDRHVVTTYVQDPARPDANSPLSERRQPAPQSIPSGVSTTLEDTPGGLSASLPGVTEAPDRPGTFNARQTPDVPELNAQGGIGGTRNIAQTADRDNIALQPTAERTSPEALQAARDIAKSATPDEIAKANGVDPKTGEFAEQYQLDQLDAEGRMTAADHEAMKTADENVKAAEAWGEALKAAVTCIL